MTPIERAVEICGGQSGLARRANVTQPAVAKWLKGGKISAESAVAVELATRGQVRRHELRPDVFDTPVVRSDLCDDQECVFRRT